ncbi:NAD(P)H-hydrate dehydratase [Alloalcanivorax mobilis]|uniref:NAD(P)H-hydrate dehydratase n=1 Tax=Alloalcanivorax mobilis TaxID=2019569 RepID=UPI000B5B235A|nr:NAD(P)H-hydrate dehydratase [Alloalcanivorax mobilis]ASK35432.1 bifunctional ADP-dependent NAD(P)H-hydrate dehydratase/NAD(P)H-hydrate epimerase [Alcanivorax sp. N3-2A]|tara:strand:- start:33003 stop:34502 length:1500 start_codon:yes stop_codon:yes gene_type:complete
MPTRVLPDRLYSAEQTRELDRLAGEAGLSGEQLMERAGQAAFDLMLQRWPGVRNPAVLCGGGNNGGDGYVLARLAWQAGLEPVIWQRKEPSQMKGDAAHMARRARDAGVPMRTLTPRQLPEQAPLLVDALLGTGLNGALRDTERALIEALNGLGKPVLAVDVPSGLCADSGASSGALLRADCTLTFIGVNRGLLTGDGPACTGELWFDDLGVPARLHRHIDAPVWRPTPADRRHWLPARRRDAHKGHFGHVLVVGGDHGFAGAPLMSAQAAGHCGAGLVSLATRAEHLPAMLARQPELMARAVDSADALKPLLEKATVVAVGPGLGAGDWGRALLECVLESGLPLVIDADGLNLLASWKVDARDDWILTPHPGEAARLLGEHGALAKQDRFAAVEALAARYGGTVLLKGQGTLVRGEAGTALISDGNPGMASGGMGDVLTGVIAALYAQGLAPFQAAALGAMVHARAADRAAHEEGERGLLATDLLSPLRRELNGKETD